MRSTYTLYGDFYLQKVLREKEDHCSVSSKEVTVNREKRSEIGGGVLKN